MEIRAVPNAKRFGIGMKDGKIIVRLKSRPENGDANRELLSEIGKICDCRVFLVRGAKSREKEIAFEGLTDEEAFKFIAGVAEPGQKK